MEKFVMLYSCGKDSTIALDRMISEGHLPMAMIVAFGNKGELSYMHAVKREMVEHYSRSLGIPLIPIFGMQAEKTERFREAIIKARDEYGVTAVCFGDIDLDWSREWGEKLCSSLGLTPYYPLWHINRRVLMDELVAKGYKCMFKSIDTTLLPRELLGRFIDAELVDELEKNENVDLCGENGEYHTVMLDGPIFRTPIPYQIDEIKEVRERAILVLSTPSQREN